jgi:deoxyribonuclease-4
MIGSHLSIAGSLANAVTDAVRLGFDTVQIFTKNQAQWAGKALTHEVISDWTQKVADSGFNATVAHDSYLINLASPDDLLWRKSIDAFIVELTNCNRLGIPYLVSHPGAHVGSGEDAGLKRVAVALDMVHDRVPSDASNLAITCLEITAGQGTTLGYRLEHLATILAGVKDAHRLAVCLDTAHLFAAGYDFRGKKYDAFMQEVDRAVGIDRVKVWHLNDSKKELGSRVDRHEHIGLGRIGLEGFKPLLRDKTFASVPKILETAKEKHESGRQWDEVNLEVLRGLM